MLRSGTSRGCEGCQASTWCATRFLVLQELVGVAVQLLMASAGTVPGSDFRVYAAAAVHHELLRSCMVREHTWLLRRMGDHAALSAVGSGPSAMMTRVITP